MNKNFIVAKKYLLAGSVSVFVLLFLGCSKTEVKEPDDVACQEVQEASEATESMKVVFPQVILRETQILVRSTADVIPEMFLERVEGVDEYICGFRKTELENTEMPVCEAYFQAQEAISETDRNVLSLKNGTEQNVMADQLTYMPALDEDGRYRAELVVADTSGNAAIFEVFIYLDSSFPVVEETELIEEQLLVQKPIPSGLDRTKAEEAFALVNEQRIAQGISVLVWDESLYDLACERAKEIVQKFSHERPDGMQVTDALYAAGCTAGNGENIAKNADVSSVVTAWMASEGHRVNILEPRFTQGVMACFCENGTYYWVNLFRA